MIHRTPANRQPHCYGGALSQSRRDLDVAAERFRPLTHSEKAKAVRLGGGRRGKSTAIVGNDHHEMAGLFPKFHPDARGLGVAGDVRQDFLEDAEESRRRVFAGLD